MKAMVIYDGSCNLCAGNLKWLRRLDWLGKLEARPYQEEAVYTRFPQLKREECEKAMQVVLADGRVFAGAEAFREIFLRMPLTCLPGLFLFLPPLMCLATRIYRPMAAHRYAISGSCEVKRHEDGRK